MFRLSPLRLACAAFSAVFILIRFIRRLICNHCDFSTRIILNCFISNAAFVVVIFHPFVGFDGVSRRIVIFGRTMAFTVAIIHAYCIVIILVSCDKFSFILTNGTKYAFS